MAEESRTLTDFAGLGGRTLLRQSGTPVSTLVVTLGAVSAVTSVDLTVDAQYRLVSDVDCYVKMGADGTITATADDMYLPAKTPMMVRVKAQFVRVAAIAGGAGKLFVTLMEA